MMKMTYELVKTFQYERVRVKDAKGNILDTYNGLDYGSAFLLGNDWYDHRIYSINPYCEILDGKIMVYLDIWIEA